MGLKMAASTTADDIRTHVELIGVDTGRSQLLPSWSILIPADYLSILLHFRVRLQPPSMSSHSGHREEGDLLGHSGITASPWETASQLLLLIIITW